MNRRIWLLTSSLLLAPPWAGGADLVSVPQPSFFLDKERGWFWREIQPDPLNPKSPDIELPPPALAPSKPTAQQVSPSPSPATVPASAPLTAAWFRQNLERFRDRAIDEPSPENVAAFYYLQRMMLDKAHRFTDVARQVVMADPNLDENRRRPVATFAANEANRLAGLATDEALAKVAQQAGLLFFFRSDCPYCHLQAPLLALLEQRFGFKVYAVSLDGRPMPGKLYPDFHADQGQARLLGVQSTPALFLMKPPDALLPLSQGALSLDELTGRILSAAHEAGWVDEAAFETTRGQRFSQARVPVAEPVPAAAFETSADPVQLIQALQTQLPIDLLTPESGGP